MTMRTSLLTIIAFATILVLQPYTTASAAVSETEFRLRLRDDDGPCDESFPLAPSSLQIQQQSVAGTNLKVAIPTDPTRRSYAPLCGDGRRIDIRRLEKCAGGMCWVASYNSCFHSTSFECDLPQETAAPTRRPTFGFVDTVHPVQLILRNVPRGYSPSAEVRALILRFITEVLKESLEDELELLNVEIAGRLPRMESENRNDRNLKSRSYQRLRQRRLEAVSIPLLVKVRGRADISDFALSFIMESIRDRFDDLMLILRKYGESMSDGDGMFQHMFSEIELRAATYDFDDILTGPTYPPSSVPTTRKPTRMPTEVPSEAPSDAVDAAGSTATEVVIMDVSIEETTKVPWWVWLIIVLVILLLCIFCLCGYTRQRRNNAEKDKQEVNIWVQNGNAPGPNKAKRKSQHTQHSRQRNMAFHDYGESSGRPSRPRPAPARPSIKRHISQTELEEARRNREYRDNIGQIEPEEENWRKRKHGDPSNQAVVANASSVDPPEENALILYNPNRRRHSESSRSDSSEEPEGLKAPRTKSMFASEVYYESEAQESNMSKSEDPDGAKIPKQQSMFAADAYHSSPVVSDDNVHQKPRRAKKKKVPKKDTIFTCSWEELPEEVQSKSRSRMDRDATEKDGPRESRKKRRKSKKKRAKGHRRPQEVSLDISHGESVAESPSILTKHPEEVRATSKGQDHQHVQRNERYGDGEHGTTRNIT